MPAAPLGPRRSALPDRHDLAALVGGAALLVSPMLQWVRRGPGNTLSGREMIDAIVPLGETLPGMSAARLAVLWYLVPASGAALWIAVGLDALRRSTAIVGALIAILAFVGFARLAGLGDLAVGPWLALAGGVTATVAVHRRT